MTQRKQPGRAQDQGAKATKPARKKLLVITPRPVAIVVAPEQRPVRTRAELRRFIDDLIDDVNRLVHRAGIEKNAESDLLFKRLYDNNAADALAGTTPPELAELRTHAGKSLRLDPKELSQHIRIGALNHLTRDEIWIHLDFEKKKELLTVAGDGVDLERFRLGVRYAAGPNVGRDAVREWVQREQPQLPGTPGRPRGLTLSGGEKWVSTGIDLSDDDKRDRFAKVVRKAPRERRKRFTRELRKTIEALAKLIAKIEEPDE